MPFNKLKGFSSITGLLRVFTFFCLFACLLLKIRNGHLKMILFKVLFCVVIMKFFSFINVMDYIMRFPNIESSLTFLDKSYLAMKIVLFRTIKFKKLALMFLSKLIVFFFVYFSCWSNISLNSSSQTFWSQNWFALLKIIEDFQRTFVYVSFLSIL